ncbi:MAG: hypothetical protein MMC33_001010 [Icmadophila ericetorum]|nr:hypothetical protein [Icmadophila ericetorum]
MPHILEEDHDLDGLRWYQKSSPDLSVGEQMELNGHEAGDMQHQLFVGKEMGLILDGEFPPTPQESILFEQARGPVLKERSENLVGGIKDDLLPRAFDDKTNRNGAEKLLHPSDDSGMVLKENAESSRLDEAAELSDSRDALNETPLVAGRIDFPGGARVRKLSAAELYKLVSSSPPPLPNMQRDLIDTMSPITEQAISMSPRVSSSESHNRSVFPSSQGGKQERKRSGSGQISPSIRTDISQPPPSVVTRDISIPLERPQSISRTISTPVMRRKQSSNKTFAVNTPPFTHTKANGSVLLPPEPAVKPSRSQKIDPTLSSPIPPSIPLPPLSIPTYLQLELSSQRPPSLFIHRPASYDNPYEPSSVKLERLINFLLLPPQLEQVLWFGAFACLDAWLYSFTILPLRFLKALSILVSSWTQNFTRETQIIANFIYAGLGRMWRRRRKGESVQIVQVGNGVPFDGGPNTESTELPILTPNYRFPPLTENAAAPSLSENRRPPLATGQKPRRPRMSPSTLMPKDKADILKGFLIIFSCIILMYFDASMMYHSIRGQAAIKLYVIYNVLEVCDRLLSALGQDVLECLFSTDVLERKPNGRSQVLRPFWLFLLALVYNVLHATSLFYQVITLNVAVNSYSNALLTLLMSNQFVEIKSTVFKKIEKDNLFQLTCADVVERFQLWLMLVIIASRNIIETNSLGSSSLSSAFGILPRSWTIFPSWTSQILTPFLLVLGTEMLVDWLKHAYITKFNNTKPNIYGRFLDVLAKDYYSNAFASQDLTARLGLPTLPLSCLFIRASVQTYHMFLATHMPPPLPSTATSLSVESALPSSSPSTTAALAHIDHIVRHALGRSIFPSERSELGWQAWLSPTTDDIVTAVTTLVIFSTAFLVLLIIKLLLGMLLLSFSRARYNAMVSRQEQKEGVMTEGKRLGGWGITEVDDEKRRWMYEDDREGLRIVREREKKMEKEREKEKDGGKKGDDDGLDGVRRYSMVAKRIW